ncbi:MAG: hypothetical protein ACFE9Z_13495 [Promethearchaeota archaeon]
MELCPNCENQITPDQVVCPLCGMILKDVRVYPKFFKFSMAFWVALIAITILVNLIGHFLVSL